MGSVHYILITKVYGTGSKPPGLSGLQRNNRQTASAVPLIAPCL